MGSRAGEGRDRGRKGAKVVTTGRGEIDARIDALERRGGKRAARPIYIEGGPRNGSRRHEGRQR